MSWRSKQRYKRAPVQRANPYFREQASSWTAARVLAIVSVVALFALLGYLLFGPWLRIRSVELQGVSEDLYEAVEGQIQERLDKRAALIIPRRQFWFVPEEQIDDSLRSAFPFNTVTIDREGRRLRVTVEEKVRTFYLMKDDTLYDIDRSGSLIGQIDDLERIRLLTSGSAEIPIIYDQRSYDVESASSVFDTAYLERIVQLYDLIEQRTLLTPIAIAIQTDERIDVQTATGVDLYVTFDRPLEDQVQKLVTLIERQIVDINELTYIDLRFTNRLYYQ